jgi:hypothetical protein
MRSSPSSRPIRYELGSDMLPNSAQKFVPNNSQSHKHKNKSHALLTLSNMLLQPVFKEAAEGKEQPDERKLLAEVCAQLRTEDLAEVLKYPFVRAKRSRSCSTNCRQSASPAFPR